MDAERDKRKSKNNLKKIYYTFVNEPLYSTEFFSEEGEYLHGFHENDGEWRSEYFNPLMRKLGFEVIWFSPEERQDLIDKLKELFPENWKE